jgi:hypothetical protein
LGWSQRAGQIVVQLGGRVVEEAVIAVGSVLEVETEVVEVAVVKEMKAYSSYFYYKRAIKQ